MNAVLLHQTLMLDSFYPFDKNACSAIAKQTDDVQHHSSSSLRVAVMEEGPVDLDGIEFNETQPR
ncbi:hypothetical protein ASF70_01840 [Rhizobium sp. Leaf321]|nr:hypothetical protein ASF70_01840 [Rhizobium sp. Leaf321]